MGACGFGFASLVLVSGLLAGCGSEEAVLPALGIERSAGASFDEGGLNTDTLAFIALDDPRMVPVAEADWIDDDDIVLGFVHESGEAHAFPTAQMSFHHIANISVAGTPYLVTYWIVCGTGISFDPVVDGTRYLYDPSGLYNGVFTMSDRQTGSVWTHYDGSVLTGPLAGEAVQLAHVPMIHATWGDWRTERPGSVVLDRYEEYANQYAQMSGLAIGDAWFGQQFRDSLLHEDDRLDPTEVVLGAGIQSEMRAYVLADLPPKLSVLHDELAGYPIVIFADPSSLFGLAFSATVDGNVLEFEVEGGRVVDSTGTTWDRSGLGTDGALAGAQLQHVTSFVSEWYGWVAFYPETTIYPAQG